MASRHVYGRLTGLVFLEERRLPVEEKAYTGRATLPPSWASRTRTVRRCGLALSTKGMIYGPQHGDTAFTVPMFDAFMRRTMPEGVG